MNHVEFILFGIDGNITANATQYLTPGSGATTANIRECRCTKAGYIRNLYVQQRVASGAAGRTDIYTVGINGGDTALTCTLNNQTQNADTTNKVVIAAGDRLRVKLVSNNASDTSADVYASFEVEYP